MCTARNFVTEIHNGITFIGSYLLYFLFVGTIVGMSTVSIDASKGGVGGLMYVVYYLEGTAVFGIDAVTVVATIYHDNDGPRFGGGRWWSG